MTAQPEAPDPRTHPIPRTIDAVAGRLAPAKRMAFYAEIGSAEGAEAITEVLEKWWMEAMFDSVPGRERRLAATAGPHARLVALPDLVSGE